MANMNKSRLNLSRTIRIPVDLLKELEFALDERVKNNLIPRNKANHPEAFKLLSRMPEWKMSLNKLARFPKKEDLR